MRRGTEEILSGVYLIGGPNVTQADDAAVYLIDFKGELVLIDAGAGGSASQLVRNIEMLGLNPALVSHVILTHCHIDHAGAAAAVAADTGCAVIAHALDAPALEKGDRRRSAASWYGTSLAPVAVTRTVRGSGETMELPLGALHLVHAPGHTPGSLVAWIDLDEPRGRTRLLFGQDVHGPLHNDFGSNHEDWQRSLRALLTLEADVLCEGHYGVIRGRNEVRRFIEQFVED